MVSARTRADGPWRGVLLLPSTPGPLDVEPAATEDAGGWNGKPIDLA